MLPEFEKVWGGSLNIQQNPSLMKICPHPQWVWKWLTIPLKLNAALDALLCTELCLIYYEASSVYAWVSLSLAMIGLNLVCFELQFYAFNPSKHGWGWEGFEISFLLHIFFKLVKLCFQTKFLLSRPIRNNIVCVNPVLTGGRCKVMWLFLYFF